VNSEVVYYTMDIVYSSDGKDSRTIIQIENAELLVLLENFRSQNYFKVEAFN